MIRASKAHQHMKIVRARCALAISNLPEFCSQIPDQNTGLLGQCRFGSVTFTGHLHWLPYPTSKHLPKSTTGQSRKTALVGLNYLCKPYTVKSRTKLGICILYNAQELPVVSKTETPSTGSTRFKYSVDKQASRHATGTSICLQLP